MPWYGAAACGCGRGMPTAGALGGGEQNVVSCCCPRPAAACVSGAGWLNSFFGVPKNRVTRLPFPPVVPIAGRPRLSGPAPHTLPRSSSHSFPAFPLFFLPCSGPSPLPSQPAGQFSFGSLSFTASLTVRRRGLRVRLKYAQCPRPWPGQALMKAAAVSAAIDR